MGQYCDGIVYGLWDTADRVVDALKNSGAKEITKVDGDKVFFSIKNTIFDPFDESALKFSKILSEYVDEQDWNHSGVLLNPECSGWVDFPFGSNVKECCRIAHKEADIEKEAYEKTKGSYSVALDKEKTRMQGKINEMTKRVFELEVELEKSKAVR